MMRDCCPHIKSGVRPLRRWQLLSTAPPQGTPEQDRRRPDHEPDIGVAVMTLAASRCVHQQRDADGGDDLSIHVVVSRRAPCAAQTAAPACRTTEH